MDQDGAALCVVDQIVAWGRIARVQDLAARAKVFVRLYQTGIALWAMIYFYGDNLVDPHTYFQIRVHLFCDIVIRAETSDYFGHLVLRFNSALADKFAVVSDRDVFVLGAALLAL